MATTGESEYGGMGVMPNGIFPQEEGVILSSSDQLMLLSSTGQTENSHAPVDPYYWHGEVAPEEIRPGPRRGSKLTKPSTRYRESQY